jgi:hypothetical protein
VHAVLAEPAVPEDDDDDEQASRTEMIEATRSTLTVRGIPHS